MLDDLLHEILIFITSSIRIMTAPEIKQFIQLQDGWIKLLTLAIFNTSCLLMNYIIKSSKFHYLYQHLGLYFTCLLADTAKHVAHHLDKSKHSIFLYHSSVCEQSKSSLSEAQTKFLVCLLSLQFSFGPITIFIINFFFFSTLKGTEVILKELSVRTLLTLLRDLSQYCLHVIVPLELHCSAETKAVTTCI